MGIVFVKKTYDDIQLFINVIIHVIPDKFALKVFNHLVYNRKISGLLVIRYLLDVKGASVYNKLR